MERVDDSGGRLGCTGTDDCYGGWIEWSLREYCCGRIRRRTERVDGEDKMERVDG